MMSLLDDAKRLNGLSPFVFHPSMSHDEPDEDECFFCHEWSKTHAPDCPWLSMPKIVAVLAAVERVILDLPETSVFLGFGQNRHCRFCGRTTYRDGQWQGTSHETDCPWPLLLAALRGDA